MILTNDLSTLQKTKEQLEQEKSLLETNLEGTTKNAYDDRIVYGKIYMAIDNLYTRVLEHNQTIKAQTKKTGIDTKTVTKKDLKVQIEGGTTTQA